MNISFHLLTFALVSPVLSIWKRLRPLSTVPSVKKASPVEKGEHDHTSCLNSQVTDVVGDCSACEIFRFFFSINQIWILDGVLQDRLNIWCLVIHLWRLNVYRPVMTEGPIEIKELGAELLTEGIRPAVKMNSQQNKVNDYRALSQTVIDLRLAWLFVFIDAIVYLFGAQRLF